MKNYTDLVCSTQEDVLVVKINRPEKRNAMRLGLREELIDALICAEDDDAVSAVVVTGMGTQAFSAGADLAELQTRTVGSELGRGALVRRRLPETAESCTKPVIAAINGACIGAGLEFVLGCAIRIASRTATFGLPEVALGVPPGSGGTQRLTRTVGLGWSMHLTLTGETIGAEQAYQIGLVTALHSPEDLEAAAVELARSLGQKPSLAFTSTRDAIQRAFDLDLSSGIDLERKLFALCLSTGEPQQRAHELLDRLTARSQRRAASAAVSS